MESQPDWTWVPEWYNHGEGPPRAAETPLLRQLEPTATLGSSVTTSSLARTLAQPEIPPQEPTPTPDDGFIRSIKTVFVAPGDGHTVDRKLSGLQLAMITINATLGSGLYWRGGLILSCGGPSGVLLAYLLSGFLAWGVMQCVTEMLCIWPVPGALTVYVSEFVDVELGIVVGIAYWFTYSVSFAASIATMAGEIRYYWDKITWHTVNPERPATGNFQLAIVEGVFIYFTIPCILILLNSLRVSLFGWMEVIVSTFKLLFLMLVICFLIAINVQVHQSGNEINYWAQARSFDERAARNWPTSLLMSISMATFAYVGVEIVAASALEARWPQQNAQPATNPPRPSERPLAISKTVKSSAAFLPLFFTVAYVLSGVLATLNISMSDPRLPRLWSREGSSSVFVVIAEKASFPHLSEVFNAILIFTALSCANTNLYVSSRSLFGLASRLDGGKNQSWILRVVAWMGRTNTRKVPFRAVVVSALAFWWVPYLSLRADMQAVSPIDILSSMGSVSIIIVWACECWAFIRFYHWHRDALEMRNIPQVSRWANRRKSDYPFRSLCQPYIAYASLFGCIFILLVMNGASLWVGFNAGYFATSYLVVIVFLLLWAVLKIIKRGNWALQDLDNEAKVIHKIRELHDFRLEASHDF